jgi:hypothetical protein
MDTTIITSIIRDSTQSTVSVSSIWTWFSSSGIGHLASVLGFLLSVYIAVTALRINRLVFINRHLPRYLKNIEEYSSRIIDLLKSFNQTVDEILDELAKCEIDLKAVKKNVPRGKRNSVSRLIKLIRHHSNKKKITEESARTIYRNLLSVAQELRNYQKAYLLER